ncbi:MAG: lipid-A-disaccharide synthase [Proteobacteria bacterium]|nr:lipid-A-disaccharide synthase [Pseudomonadota bacterium]
MKKFFIIAGEASGDLLGSKLIRELKLLQPSSVFLGVGGKLMKEQGLVSIFPMEDLSVMGFAEVLPHLPKLLRRIKQTAETINQEKPDYVITIDSPDFSFRVIKKVEGGFKKVHLIAPSVWAYRPGRAKKISKLYDLLLCILPFEPPYFEKYGLKTIFIGHPLLEDRSFEQESKSKDELLIALTPGSRTSEVKKIFPEFIGAINSLAPKFPNLKVVIPLIDKTRDLVVEMSKSLQVSYFFCEQSEKKSVFSKVNFALAKSGTNTLEFSLNRIPMIVAYKVNWISYFLIKMMIKIRFGNLLNLILNREIIPEMMQKNCQSKKISAALEKLISQPNLAQKQIEETATALKILGLGSLDNPSRKAAKEILG